jgi:hypothetical protein
MGRIAPVLLFLWAAQCAMAQTKAWQDTITLPTWQEGPPDIHPKFAVLEPQSAIYPYTARLNFGTHRQPQSWRRLNLENEYLVCSFLPDIGGHLYTCRDKRNNRPMFRENQSVKKAEIGPRGAWVSMAIEFNFPVAHSLDRVSPVDFGVRQEKGYGAVWLADTDRASGMRWLAEFILRDGSAALEERMTLRNPTAVRHTYQYWADADLDVDSGTRFVFPTAIMASHGAADLYAWPKPRANADWSKPFTVPDMLGLFAYGTREPFFAVYNADSRTATVHVADPGAVSGKKLYHWGSTNMPDWSERLSDTKSPFIEMQAGVFPNQEAFEFLQPGEQRQFTELWMPGRDLSDVSRANEHAILSVTRSSSGAGEELVAQLNVTHTIPGAHLAMLQGAGEKWQPAWEDKLDLSPAKTYERRFPNPEKSPCRFELRDAAGKLLMVHTEGVYEAVPADAARMGAQLPVGIGPRRNSPADFLKAGQEDEQNEGDYAGAEREYRAGLKRFANAPELQKALGRLLVERRRYAEAAPVLSAASEKLILDQELRYYQGVALARSGKDEEARKAFQISAVDQRFKPSALFELALMDTKPEARANHPAAALDLAQQAIQARPSFIAARRLQIALLRHANQNDELRKALGEALGLDPLDSFLRVEATRLGATDEEIWRHLAADPDRVLDLAGAYIDFGFYADALELLSRKYEAVPANETEPGAALPQDYALVAYYRAYCELKLGRDPSADLALASSQSLKYVFPHRAGDRAVLVEALEAKPHDSSALFLAGLLDLDEDRTGEAAGKLKAAFEIRKNIPAMDYVLGRTLLAAGDKKGSISILRAGLSADPALKAALDEAIHAPDSPPPAAAASARASTATGPAPPPRVGKGANVKLPGSPTQIAMQILGLTAELEPLTSSYFTTLNFPDRKEPPEVLRAYVEVQLQMARRAAAAKDCSGALSRLDNSGDDPALPFTFQSLDAYMTGARYQYFLAAVESLCGLPKDAKRRWERVAKMTPEIDSPDFAFPLAASQSLASSANASVDVVDPILSKIEKRFSAANDEVKGALNYNKGILLLCIGEEKGAIAAFTAGLKAPESGFSHYLNQLAISEARHAKGK